MLYLTSGNKSALYVFLIPKRQTHAYVLICMYRHVHVDICIYDIYMDICMWMYMYMCSHVCFIFKIDLLILLFLLCFSIPNVCY